MITCCLKKKHVAHKMENRLSVCIIIKSLMFAWMIFIATPFCICFTIIVSFPESFGFKIFVFQQKEKNPNNCDCPCFRKQWMLCQTQCTVHVVEVLWSKKRRKTLTWLDVLFVSLLSALCVTGSGTRLVVYIGIRTVSIHFMLGYFKLKLLYFYILIKKNM